MIYFLSPKTKSIICITNLECRQYTGAITSMIISDDRHVCSQKGGKKLGFQLFGARKGYDEKTGLQAQASFVFWESFCAPRKAVRKVRQNRLLILGR